MERTFSQNLKDKIGKSVLLLGRVYSLRILGDELAFLNLQDKDGIVQCVFEGENTNERLKDVKVGSIVKVEGVVKEEKRAPLGVELKAESINVLVNIKEELPFDMSKKELKVELATLLDQRSLTIRHEKIRAIFRIYDSVLKSYASSMRKLGCIEIKTPKMIGTASEGGANFFLVDYFEKKAFLAQSPQLYKQICVGAFERVFEIGPAFRAERHFTTRHINEYTSLDAEIGFIDDHTDLMKMLSFVVKEIFDHVLKNNENELSLYSAEPPLIPNEIPSIKLSEIKKIIKEKYNYEIPKDTDIDPKGEALAGEFAKKEFNSDFLFITHYPKLDRPFYTMPDDENPNETKSFDLLFKGLEIATGSQRIHDYDQLKENIKFFGLDENQFNHYLDAFKYAMPPHGGWGMGSERIVFKLLNLGSVKEAVLFPRDVKRLHP